MKPSEAPQDGQCSPAAGRCRQLPAEPERQDRQHGLWVPFYFSSRSFPGRAAGVSSSEGVSAGAPPALTPCLAGGTRGTPRAAGSAPSSCTRWIPARMPIPISSPRRRPATSTRSSVSGLEGRKGLGVSADGVHPTVLGPSSPLGTTPPQGPRLAPWQPLSPLPAVHNVKPECLDAYNSLT